MHEVRLCEWVEALRAYIPVGQAVERNLRQSDAERLAFQLNVKNKLGIQTTQRYMARKVEVRQGNE